MLLVALCVLVAVLFVVVPSQADTYLTDTLWERGKAVAKEIERKVPIAARESIDSEASAEVNNIVGGERAIRNVWVLACSGECRPKDVIAQSSETALTTTEAAIFCTLAATSSLVVDISMMLELDSSADW